MTQLETPASYPICSDKEQLRFQQVTEGSECIRQMARKAVSDGRLLAECDALMPAYWRDCALDLFASLPRDISVIASTVNVSISFVHSLGVSLSVDEGRVIGGFGDELARVLLRYCLAGCGLDEVSSTAEPTERTSALVEQAVALAFNDKSTQQAPHYFAQALAGIASVVVPALIVHLFANGVKFNGRWIVEGRGVRNLVEKLPAEILNLPQYCRQLGITAPEMRNLISASIDGIIGVRGCDPARFDLLTGDFAPAPACLPSPPTPASGDYQGQLVFTAEELDRLVRRLPEDVSLEDEGDGAGRFEYEDAGESEDRRHIPSDLSNLHGHAIEPVTWLDEYKRPQRGFRLLDPRGRPIIVSVESVFWIRVEEYFTRSGHSRLGPWTAAGLYADRMEVGLAHNFILQFTGKLDESLRDTPFHKTQVRLDASERGNAVFTNRSAENRFLDGRDPVLVVAKAHAYMLSWVEFAELCRCCFTVQQYFPWKEILSEPARG